MHVYVIELVIKILINIIVNNYPWKLNKKNIYNIIFDYCNIQKVIDFINIWTRIIITFY